MPSDKQIDLVELEELIKKTDPTPKLREQATQLVFGAGNPNADIVFIGEAPGKNEDMQGKPFVGASGKFLDEMLNDINLGREDIYITNIVKYRPPNNRDPSPGEKKAFLPYLERQLEIIAPKLIVTLGRHSTHCFLPDLQISKDHGQPKSLKIRLKNEPSGIMKLIILPLYHPAAALYNGSMRQVLVDDFMNIPIILKKISKLTS